MGIVVCVLCERRLQKWRREWRGKLVRIGIAPHVHDFHHHAGSRDHLGIPGREVAMVSLRYPCKSCIQLHIALKVYLKKKCIYGLATEIHHDIN